MADNLLATQLRKGMIVKIDNNLYRIFDRQHVTPGNLRGFVRVKMRNIKNGSMAEEKFRSEDIVERVSLEQNDMQYLYNRSEERRVGRECEKSRKQPRSGDRNWTDKYKLEPNTPNVDE